MRTSASAGASAVPSCAAGMLGTAMTQGLIAYAASGARPREPCVARAIGGSPP
ncbi:hypothetical protein L504_2434 [Bordetella bronchiseptica F2]|nr:hypothetical protein L542_2401 [Bordetella bronchiseptica F-1]KDC26241.1 hypothetical protein L504_2434 [Bordetella bronchiseptica F2]